MISSSESGAPNGTARFAANGRRTYSGAAGPSSVCPALALHQGGASCRPPAAEEGIAAEAGLRDRAWHGAVRRFACRAEEAAAFLGRSGHHLAALRAALQEGIRERRQGRLRGVAAAVRARDSARAEGGRQLRAEHRGQL